MQELPTRHRATRDSTIAVRRVLSLCALVLVSLIGAAATGQNQDRGPGVPLQPPRGFIPPPLNPTGARLETVRLADGVYALLADRPGVDNSGFVMGERGVLVVDAHFNQEMAGQIQRAVREVTAKPILYLVNTNYHGDHTFGNHAFPPQTLVVAHRATAERMSDFEREKQAMLGAVGGDSAVFAAVTPRPPDIILAVTSVSISAGGRLSSTTSVRGIRRATRSCTCPRRALHGPGTSSWASEAHAFPGSSRAGRCPT